MAGKDEFAREVDYLFDLARKKLADSPTLAKKYVSMARALAMRHRIPLGKERKRLFCKACGMPQIAGRNVKVRLVAREKKAVYTCACGAKRAFAYSNRAKK